MTELGASQQPPQAPQSVGSSASSEPVNSQVDRMCCFKRDTTQRPRPRPAARVSASRHRTRPCPRPVENGTPGQPSRDVGVKRALLRGPRVLVSARHDAPGGLCRVAAVGWFLRCRESFSKPIWALS